jgi:D-cysteine desulfhydrase
MSLHHHEPPRLELAELPTPVVDLPRLAGVAGIPRIAVKRDDLTGLELSGNKIRKLEYVVADALAQGADTLVTHGGFQSNHCRATAAVGAKLGLRVRMLLRSPEDSPEWEGNLFLDHLFGADVTHHAPDVYRADLEALVDVAMQAERDAGRTPYFFPVGASVPLGCWGYIRCVAEMAEQVGRETEVDVYCATSSAGTLAGLMLGRALSGCQRWRILGIPVSDSVEYFQTRLRELERETNDAFQLGLSPQDTPIELIDGYIGEGYAIPYPEAVETIRLVGRTEGIVLDPSYTSKAMTGMLAELQAGRGRRDALPLFVHTGGAFGLFARRDLIGGG